MPGTILVSVLEFMDLPFSSSTPIRASMGKIEYQISDKGNFSFPIASLRDDLIFKIHDTEGNEISRAGVHIRMILEKGVWEDTFPLGEGYLHLKLQVVLSNEERDRIRMMRQTALKKKQDGILSNVALPFRASDEVSVMNLVLHTFPQRLFPDVLSAPSSQESSPKQYFQHEEVPRLQSHVDFSNDKESATTNVAETEADIEQKRLKSNSADQYNKTASVKPMSQEVNLVQSECGGEKPDNQPPSENHPQRATGSKEMVILLSSEKVNSSTNNPIQDNLEDEGPPNSEKKARLGRTPSNVKKMISAFESGLPKDMRPHIKPPPIKYQVMSPIEKKDSSEPIGFLQENSKSASLVRDLQEVPEHIEEIRQQIHIGNRQIDSNARNEDQEEEQIHIPNRQIDSNSYIKTEIDGSKYEKIQDIKESKINTFDDNEDENSGGPFNQVIKVAIIIGFGLLVLLTRQRNKRKDKRA